MFQKVESALPSFSDVNCSCDVCCWYDSFPNLVTTLVVTVHCLSGYWISIFSIACFEVDFVDSAFKHLI